MRQMVGEFIMDSRLRGNDRVFNEYLSGYAV